MEVVHHECEGAADDQIGFEDDPRNPQEAWYMAVPTRRQEG